MIRRPPRSTQGVSSAASDVYKRQVHGDGNNPIGVYILDGEATIVTEEPIDENSAMMKIGDIKFFKYYTELKEPEESESFKRFDDTSMEGATHKIPVKIKKPMFLVHEYTKEEAANLRKKLPRF
eukprot:TRINITY_DN55110_c0_g1_i3.p2 TRINITY_DN55110_c0_g1~~TRINITY_DN55110_c0_g1_i3.p2  ORF type:complete len:124 (-),score=39.14 TRINITY_DN55110_c0_g1_i3:239-610(-)